MGSGTPVGINVAVGTTRATLVANSVGDGWFGVIIGQTTAGVPIVRIVQPVPGDANTVADKTATGS